MRVLASSDVILLFVKMFKVRVSPAFAYFGFALSLSKVIGAAKSIFMTCIAVPKVPPGVSTKTYGIPSTILMATSSRTTKGIPSVSMGNRMYR